MKLEKFNKKNSKHVLMFILIGISLVMVGIVIEKTFANYKEVKSFNVIEGTVKYEGTGDVYVAAYVDGVQSNVFPNKASYNFEKGECTNGGVIIFDKANWKATVSEVTVPKTKCNLYFVSKLERANIYDMMVEQAKSDTTNLAYDGTAQNNLRYIGSNPNNYVTFNDELWRIIGAFNDVDDGTGIKETRIKIMKDTSIGNKKWDASVNDWNTSNLKEELNGAYLSGLNAVAKEMINDVMWPIGKTSTSNQLNSIIYVEERNGLSWLGKIAIMDASDYGYAVGGISRATCLNTNLYDWNIHSECYNSDWIFNNENQWLLTVISINPDLALRLNNSGYVVTGYNYANVYYTFGVRPTLYLSSDVGIAPGDTNGIREKPYQLIQ